MTTTDDEAIGILVGDLVRERRGRGGRLYHGETAVDFYGRRWWGLTVSIILLVLSIGSLFTRGLNLSIDFEGGVVWAIPSSTLSEDAARAVLDDNGINSTQAKVQILVNQDTGLRTVEVQVGVQTDEVRKQLKEAYAEVVGVEAEQVSSNSVSSTWGDTITNKAITVLLVFLVLVAAFIGCHARRTAFWCCRHRRWNSMRRPGAAPYCDGSLRGCW